MSTRVLAFEAWDAGSHRAVRRSIEHHGTLAWHFLTLPGRSPKWRLRHAALRFSEVVRDGMGGGGEPPFPLLDADAIVATGMLSASDLRATLPRPLRDRPLILSMHENQIAYPTSDGGKAVDRDRDAHLAFTNLASIEASDRVVWNSCWNLESFVAGMRNILSHAPEPLGGRWEDRLRDRSVVVPPPVEFDEVEAAVILHNKSHVGYPDLESRRHDLIRVAWPHRWEHDKGCDEFLLLADEAWRREQDGGPAIRWVILGQPRKTVPEALKTLLQRHESRVEQAGSLPRPDYLRRLAGCDWVLSTATHEFFGLAVAEALIAGCRPWLPDRLSYPELVPADAIGLDPWSDPGWNATDERKPTTQEAESLQARIRAGLEPARAANAVQRLETIVQESLDAAVDETNA